MPVKRRQSKRRPFAVSLEAVARWRKVGPEALGWNHVADDVLADMLDVPVLCAIAPDDMAELRAELEAGGRHAD